MSVSNFFITLSNNSHSTAALTWLIRMVFLLLVLSGTFAYAANNTSANAQNTASTQPENITQYFKQQVDSINIEDIDPAKITNEILDPSEKKAVNQAGYLQGDISLVGEYDPNYYLLDELNSGLPPLLKPPNLATPLSTLEFFNQQS